MGLLYPETHFGIFESPSFSGEANHHTSYLQSLEVGKGSVASCVPALLIFLLQQPARKGTFSFSAYLMFSFRFPSLEHCELPSDEWGIVIIVYCFLFFID